MRYFFSWWAAFGIPYLGLQLMIIVIKPVDFSGNGPDSAAAGYFHVPAEALAAIRVIGFMYYMLSGRWVLQVMRAVDPRVLPQADVASVSAWRSALGWVMIAFGIVSIVRFADWAFQSHISGPFIGEAVLAWAIACAILTRWKTPAARGVWTRWLAPGIIGMLALVPLGFIGGGNDFVEIGIFVLSPVFAAAMFAGREKPLTERPRDYEKKAVVRKPDSQ